VSRVKQVYHLVVPGHAKPSVRITERTKHLKQARDYLEWQRTVAMVALQIRPRPLLWQWFRVDILAYFVGPPTGNQITHADRMNMGKAVEDGLAHARVFPPRGRTESDDSRIMDGNVGTRYVQTATEERVEIWISEYREGGGE
jgi:Holliday junction resolvase RusA-like endonuclease